MLEKKKESARACVCVNDITYLTHAESVLHDL